MGVDAFVARKWSWSVVGRGSLVAALLVAAPVSARDLPSYHRVFSEPLKSGSASGLRALSTRVPRPSSATSFEPRFGLPTVLRAPYTGRGAAPAAHTPVEAAREHLRSSAQAYFLADSDVDAAVVKHVHDTGRGAIVVQLVSRPGGLEVWGEQLNVVMDRQFRLVGLTGYLSTPTSAASLVSASRSAPGASVKPFSLGHPAAVAAAYADLTGSPLGAGAFAENGVVRGEYHGVQLRAGVSTPSPLAFPARARQVLFHQPGTLVPAYYVEVASPDPRTRGLDYYGYVISGRDGSVLVRSNLKASAEPFTYRVWADSGGIHQPYISPVGNAETPAPGSAPVASYVLPPAVARQDVSLVSGPISTGDPWLKDEATETVGNNVHAYTDLGGVDGYNPGLTGPDYTAQTTGSRAFLYDWSDADGANSKEAQNKAAITQLFFLINWLHDWYYDHGFDEAAGNAQDDNYGRGPPGGDLDAILAETNDFSGVDNADMWSPADGAPPRMQMFVFDGPSDVTTLTTTPDVGLGTQAQGFYKPMGQGVRNFDVTAPVVRAVPHDACAPLTNGAAVSGKIILIDRGTCGFDVKAGNAVAAGAVGVLIWNATNGAFGGGFGASSPQNTVGNIIIDFPHGQALTSAVDGGPVTAHMNRVAKDLDGALDEGIVAHEWGHHIQHRLIAGGAQDSTQGAEMGEGWSDVHALLFAVREEDQQVPGNENWLGAYGAGNYAPYIFSNDERWFGTRRVTYSADLAKNGVTFRYIRDAVDGSAPGFPFPYLGTAGDDPTEVHNGGEIWATMLFDCYVSLLQSYPFGEAQNRMKDYLVASYKVTPAFPTFVEARDAFLQVAAASSLEDYDRFGQAFARRGLGIGAVAPDRGDGANSTLTESFVWGNNFSVQSVAIVDGLTNCDGDGVIDPGETGAVEVTIRNIGKQTLGGTTATATSSTAGVSFPAPGAVATFAALAPGALGTVRIPLTLAASAALGSIEVQVTVDAPGIDPAGASSQSATVSAAANLDDVPTEIHETFGTLDTPWRIYVAPHTMGLPPGTVWFRTLQGNSDDGSSFQAGTNIQADESIVSPPLLVAATGDFTLSFEHLFFNSRGAPTDSGLVVELSDDDGATWTDMAEVAGAEITGGYNDVIATEDPRFTSFERNPLEGRAAFTGVNPSLDAGTALFDTVQANFHGAYAGKTVLVRFRYGAAFDEFVTSWNYELDNVVVGGLTNTPFFADVADRKICVPIADAGPDQTVNEQSLATLLGAAPDLSGNPVTYHWAQVDGPTVHLSDSSSLTPSFTAPLVSADTPLTFQLTAVGTNGTRTALTHVTVKDVGHAPVAVISGAGTTVAPGATVSLSGASSTDPDGDALTYVWSQVSGSAGTFSASTGPTVTFAAPSTTGNVTLGLRVTDAKGLTATTNAALSVSSSAGGADSGCGSAAAPSVPALALLTAAALLGSRRRRER